MRQIWVKITKISRNKTQILAHFTDFNAYSEQLDENYRNFATKSIISYKVITLY